MPPLFSIGTEHGTLLKECVPFVPVPFPFCRDNVPFMFRPVPCSGLSRRR